jgi:hypothetical protein
MIPVDNSNEYKAPVLSPRELIDTFPEAIPAIKRNLKLLKKLLGPAEKTLSELTQLNLDEVYKANFSESAIENIWKHAASYLYDQIIPAAKKRIAFLEMLLRINQIKNAGLDPETQSLDISRAKSYPIENLIKVDHNGFTKCPFHLETLASFKIYRKQNRFHCFSCSANGDSIDLVMKMNNIDFKSAVKFLNEK